MEKEESDSELYHIIWIPISKQKYETFKGTRKYENVIIRKLEWLSDKIDFKTDIISTGK